MVDNGGGPGAAPPTEVQVSCYRSAVALTTCSLGTGEAGGIGLEKPARMLAPSSEAGTGRPKKNPWT